MNTLRGKNTALQTAIQVAPQAAGRWANGPIVMMSTGRPKAAATNARDRQAPDKYDAIIGQP